MSPLLAPDEHEVFEKFLDEITDGGIETSVKFKTTISAVRNADYIADQNSEIVFPTFTGFKCRVYHLLSGKITRIFRSGTADMIADFGKLDETVWVVEYIANRFELSAGSGAAENVIGSNTILIDSSANFILQGVRVGAKVLNLTDGSEATVTVVAATQLTVDGLQGGITDEFIAADQYEILNKNYLLEADQVLLPHTNHWGTVLNTIPDSEGLQIATFVKDV